MESDPQKNVQVLVDERKRLEEAMRKATEEGTQQKVSIGGEEFIVADPGRAGREIKPA